MAATKVQIDASENTFKAFAKADLEAQQKLAHYKEWVNSKWIKPNFTVDEYRVAREGGNANDMTPTKEQQVVIDALDAADKAAQAFRTARGASKANSANTELFIAKVHSLHVAGTPATPENTMIKNAIGKGEDISFGQTIKEGRDRLAAEEKAAAEKAAEKAAADTARKAAQDAAQAKAAGIDRLKETTALVSKGALIKIDGTSKAHEPARVEVATALSRYFVGLGGVEKTKAWKALGLKDDETITARLLGEEAPKSMDRKLLGKALRYYQAENGLVADGKVGQATLEDLLYNNNVRDGAYTGFMVASVSQSRTPPENEPGQLGGKRNPYSLRGYEDGADTDPKMDAAKQQARNAMANAERVFLDLAEAVAGQETKIQAGPAAKVYTQKEHDALKALFEAKDGKAPIKIDDAINADQVKAFQKAFGLKADGIIGEETARALAQINLRLKTDQVIDPSEISQAVHNLAPKAKGAPAK